MTVHKYNKRISKKRNRTDVTKKETTFLIHNICHKQLDSSAILKPTTSSGQKFNHSENSAFLFIENPDLAWSHWGTIRKKKEKKNTWKGTTNGRMCATAMNGRRNRPPGCFSFWVAHHIYYIILRLRHDHLAHWLCALPVVAHVVQHFPFFYTHTHAACVCISNEKNLSSCRYPK